MKKIINILIACFIALIVAAPFINATNYDNITHGYHKEWNMVDGDIIYYYDLNIDQIDAETFQNPESINMAYGHDKNNVYYEGEYILEGLDPKNYIIGISGIEGESINKYIAYDKNTLCFKNTCIQADTPEKAELISDDINSSVLRIENKVYEIYKGTSHPYNNKINLVTEDSQSDNFSEGYKITDDAVYWYGEKIEEADPISFEIGIDYNNELARDKNNVYNKGKFIYDADPATFQIFRIEIDDRTGLYTNLDQNTLYNTDTFLPEKSLEDFKLEYPDEASNIDKSIESAIEEYESKYPDYEPQPAKPPIKAKNVWPYAVGALVVLAGGVGIVRRKKK